MPFTGSHPAAVLPLMRSGLPPSALVVGAMAPDLPYYVPLLPHFGVTHSLAGVITVDPLYGSAVLVLWHTLWAPLALAVAPAAVRERIVPGRVDARFVLLAFPGLAVGALTHVVWDSFTHEGRWGPDHIGWLAARHAGLPGYRWAQYASGVVGAVMIAVCLLRWWRRHARQHGGVPPASRALRIATVIGIVSVSVAAGLLGGLAERDDPDPYHVVFVAITRAGGAALAVATALGLHLRLRRPAARASQPLVDHRDEALDDRVR